jgi:hypothetical protein
VALEQRKTFATLPAAHLQADSVISRGNAIYQRWKYNLSAVVVHSRFSDTEMQFITCRNVISTLEQ